MMELKSTGDTAKNSEVPIITITNNIESKTAGGDNAGEKEGS